MGLQRHIKVRGTFARLYLRDGKSAYLDDLPLVVHYVQEIADKYQVETIDLGFLVENGIVHKNDKVKILGRGEVSVKLSVTAHAASAGAKEAIEKVGGSVQLV